MGDAFRTALKKVRSQAEATALLREAVAPFGFCDFNYGCFNYLASLTSSFPVVWTDAYLDDGYYRTDRLVAAARTRIAPFLVHDVLIEPPATVVDAAMENIITRYYQGLVVPIHCPETGFASAGLFSRMERKAFEEMAEQARGPVTVMVLDYHEAVRRFFLGGPTVDGRKGLSRREREILGWAARGKTSDEIAGIVGLSVATVNNHVSTIRKKLKVNSRSEAIAVALANGQITKPS